MDAITCPRCLDGGLVASGLGVDVPWLSIVASEHLAAALVRECFVPAPCPDCGEVSAGAALDPYFAGYIAGHRDACATARRALSHEKRARMAGASIVALARTLAEHVLYDQRGRIVDGQARGGNGGLLAHETVVAAEHLARAVEIYTEAMGGDHE